MTGKGNGMPCQRSTNQWEQGAAFKNVDPFNPVNEGTDRGGGIGRVTLRDARGATITCDE
jgi:hypothetical protein